jgi:hypothetical protein
LKSPDPAYRAGMWVTSLCVLADSTTLVLGGARLLHLLPRFGTAGRRITATLARAPSLDGVMTHFIIVPLVAGPLIAGWAGLGAAVLGQLIGLLGWIGLHELAHPGARQGPRIVNVLDRLLGRWRNHAALWVMLPAVPLFWLVRVTQMTVYPALVRLVGLPRYRTGDWVNLSRHKFKELVGHDLIWCLYCDWMTGLWRWARRCCATSSRCGAPSASRTAKSASTACASFRTWPRATAIGAGRRPTGRWTR